ncbi:hypothetical protein C9426_28070 [Serratia sp. S1B]|nr:hypothetical protein C9426_28070 [Serratia sp. S1B]
MNGVFSTKNVSIYATENLSQHEEENVIIPLVKAYLSAYDDFFYIGISEKAISFLRIDSHRSIKREIILRDINGLKENFLCGIKIITDDTPTEKTKIPLIKIDGNSKTWFTSYNIYESCGDNTDSPIGINGRITALYDPLNDKSTKAGESSFIFDISVLRKGKEIHQQNGSGYVRSSILNGNIYENWNIKSKSIISHEQTFDHNPVIVENIRKLMNSDEPLISRKITEGIYAIDIFGGILISTR